MSMSQTLRIICALLPHATSSSGKEQQSSSSSNVSAPIQKPKSGSEQKIAINRDKFVNQMLDWTKSVSTDKVAKKYGHAYVHALLASVYWSEKRYELARYHFSLANRAIDCANFLIEYQSLKGYVGEIELFITQMLLHLLCFQWVDEAKTCLFEYSTKHPQIATTPPIPGGRFPLINFLHFLLLAINGKQPCGTYAILCEQYMTSLNRDANYKSLLDKIGQIYFGMPPPPKRAQTGGLFGGAFINNLLKGMIDESSDEEGASLSTGAKAVLSSTTDQNCDMNDDDVLD